MISRISTLQARPTNLGRLSVGVVVMWLYATKRGSRPLIGVARTVFQPTLQCNSRRRR